MSVIQVVHLAKKFKENYIFRLTHIIFDIEIEVPGAMVIYKIQPLP